jgi:hypothetical protein
MRGDIPEIHLRLSGSAVVIRPEYQVNGMDWEHSLREAAGFSPKPFLMVHADRRKSCESNMKSLERIANTYACSPSKCFLMSHGDRGLD